jgi:hypothetical protein
MEAKDEKLWKLAKQKAALKITGSLYILSLIIIWVVYWIIGDNTYMWPKWPTLGLFLAYSFQYIAVYQLNHESLAEKEYKKLKRD